MKTEVKVSVITYPNNKAPIARVRKAVFGAGGKVLGKWGLSRSGRWMRIPAGAMWPDNAELEVMIGQAAPEESA